MTKANQKVKYSYICPKCKKFHDVTFNMNVTLCDMDDIDEMELRLNEPINDAFIERVARELGWRRPNEIIFINGIPG